MPFMVGLAIATLLLWIGSARRRRRERDRNSREVATTLATGMPAPETALGRKAREVSEAQLDKLQSSPPIHGTARWAEPRDAAPLLDGNNLRAMKGSSSLRLGSLMTGEGEDTDIPVVVRYPGHILTVAATGQGKSATQIVDNLMTYTGSVVVIDPKGELFDLTSRRRREYGRVFRLAPLAKHGEHTDRYNPLDELADPRELGARARRLAEMLIVRQSAKGAAEAAFFENEAINLLTALLMVVVEITEPPQLRANRTLSEIRRVCTLPILAGRKERDPKVREYLEDVFQVMGHSKHPYVRRQAALFAGYEQKLLSSFLSEINSNMAFFDGHPGFAEVTAASDFRCADLAGTPTTVYLTIPLKELPTSYRFLRAMVGVAFSALEEQPDAREASVLFVLDEFPALKDMEFMREAVAQMRSSGAWFWFFVQDVAQLEATYGTWSNVFLSQTDHQIYFGATSDMQTKKHVSTALGVSTFAYRDANVNWSQSVGVNDSETMSPMQMGSIGSGRNIGQSINISEPVVLAPKPLLTPFEVGTFLSERRAGETHSSTAIVFSKQAGGYPVRLRRHHWRDLQPVARPLALIPYFRRKEA